MSSQYITPKIHFTNTTYAVPIIGTDNKLYIFLKKRLSNRKPRLTGYMRTYSIKTYCSCFTENIIKHWLHALMVCPFKNVKSQSFWIKQKEWTTLKQISLHNNPNRSIYHTVFVPPCHRPPVMSEIKWKNGKSSRLYFFKEC